MSRGAARRTAGGVPHGGPTVLCDLKPCFPPLTLQTRSQGVALHATRARRSSMEPPLGDMVIPNALYDAEKAKRQPYGSRAVRSLQVRRACQDDYAPGDVLQVAAANPGTDARCDAVLDAGTCVADEDDDSTRQRLCALAATRT